uniref:Uncharacterized protein n=1 Tax=Noctiluca scintillans TaxID=2966 RepID=A0A7S0ZWT4_NOCSC|mmetsp:Transcript_22159/g.58749  ORF Transcript_22159/g.58749 Transcript_22159/m.58749 type:complete len:144 (+) Transcript_22159:44-475(+)
MSAVPAAHRDDMMQSGGPVINTKCSEESPQVVFRCCHCQHFIQDGDSVHMRDGSCFCRECRNRASLQLSSSGCFSSGHTTPHRTPIPESLPPDRPRRSRISACCRVFMLPRTMPIKNSQATASLKDRFEASSKECDVGNSPVA